MNVNWDNMDDFERQDYEDFKAYGKNYIDDFLNDRELRIQQEFDEMRLNYDII